MKVRKVTVNLPEEDIAFLQRFAEEKHTTVTGALRQAISTERFLHDQEARGSKILIEDADRQLMRVIRQ
jgi:hypothetical protein